METPTPRDPLPKLDEMGTSVITPDPQAAFSHALTVALQATNEAKQLLAIGWTPVCKLRPMRQSFSEDTPGKFIQPVMLTISRRSILISTIVETEITSLAPVARVRELLVPMMALGTGAVAISETLDA